MAINPDLETICTCSVSLDHDHTFGSLTRDAQRESNKLAYLTFDSRLAWF